MADANAGFGRRTAMTQSSVSAVRPVGKIHFSLIAFLAATAILALAIPVLNVLAYLWQGKNSGEMFLKSPGSNTGLRFFAYWLECMVVFALPLAIAGFPQRILMNRKNWTSRAHSAALGGGWAFFGFLVLGAFADMHARHPIHLAVFFLGAICAIPFGVAQGLIYRSLGGHRPS